MRLWRKTVLVSSSLLSLLPFLVFSEGCVPFMWQICPEITFPAFPVQSPVFAITAYSVLKLPSSEIKSPFSQHSFTVSLKCELLYLYCEGEITFCRKTASITFVGSQTEHVFVTLCLHCLHVKLLILSIYLCHIWTSHWTSLFCGFV